MSKKPQYRVLAKVDVSGKVFTMTFAVARQYVTANWVRAGLEATIDENGMTHLFTPKYAVIKRRAHRGVWVVDRGKLFDGMSPRDEGFVFPHAFPTIDAAVMALMLLKVEL